MTAFRLAALTLSLALPALEPKAPPAPAPAETVAAPAPSSEARIALPTLARTLETDRSRVRAYEALSRPSSAALEAERGLPEVNATLARLDANLLAASPDNLTFRELDLIRIGWLGADATLSRWESALEHDAKVVDDARKDLKAIEESWRTATDEDWHGTLPPALSERIDELVLKTVEVHESMNARTAVLLVVQDEVSADRGRVRDAIDRTFALSTAVGEHLFAVEKNTLWAALTEAHPGTTLTGQTIGAWRAFVSDVWEILQGRLDLLVLQFAVFAAIALGGLYLERTTRRDPGADDAAKDAAAFLDRPFAASLALTLFATFWMYPAAAFAVREMAVTLMVLPYLRLVPKVAAPALRPQAYGLGVLFFLDRLHDLASAHSLPQRLVLLAIGLLGVVGWLWAHRATVRFDRAGAPSWGLGWRVLVRIAIASLAIAIVANVVGNVSLAEQLTVVAIKGVFAGAFLYFVARILESLYILMLRYLQSLGSRIVVRNAELLERRGRKTIRAIAIGLWVFFILWIMRIVEQSGQMVVGIFSRRWTLGHVEIGLGALVSFAAALTIGIVAARILRFVLDEAVFPRMSLPRGIPAAISATVGYLIVTAGFVMAFFAAGLEMSQFAFLAGAFGLGIGFGLQNIVNNFVSGLILLYERPIQVGDVLEVGALKGHVRRIGIRSSTLATFDGAEVIVPNATLIATDVVNWTLSDRRRRVDIAVGAGYGSDPRVVLDTLIGVAHRNTSVLKFPTVTALFMGFGDSSLNFELRFWAPDYDTSNIVASEVRTEIITAFKEAGIDIPFPQRDLHIKSMEAAPER